GRHVVLRIRRPAIHAAEIAAVRNRNPQVGDRPAEFVSERHASLSRQKSKRPNPCLDLGAAPGDAFACQAFPFPNTGGPGVSARTLSPLCQVKWFGASPPGHGMSLLQAAEVGELNGHSTLAPQAKQIAYP